MWPTERIRPTERIWRNTNIQEVDKRDVGTDEVDSKAADIGELRLQLTSSPERWRQVVKKAQEARHCRFSRQRPLYPRRIKEHRDRPLGSGPYI